MKEKDTQFNSLSDRKKQILCKTIEDYIEDVQPITSGRVHDKHLKNISTATLRNELSALEAMGYLKQLHTSSGRVPTSKGYRLFVNELMNQSDFIAEDLSVIRKMFEGRTNNLNDIVNTIAKTISKVTNYPSVVVLNGFDRLTIESVKIIPVIGFKAVVLISTSTGIINNTIEIGENVTEQNCLDASNFLTKYFNGRTIADMLLNMKDCQKSMDNELNEFKNLFYSLITCLTELSSNNKTRLASEGKIKLLNQPEYSDFNHAKKILHLLDNDDELKQIFKQKNSYSDISFKIGKENEHEGLEDCSVITANYTVNGNNIASISIIGPERMQYSKAAAVLKYIVSELTTIKQLPNSFYKEDEE